jgi:hypothetical protein
MQVFESSPRSFAAMLALHVGRGSPSGYAANGSALGTHILKA